ncbi:DM13 domain-containing protein [Colwellia sp. 1_MG-2023]|uniref:DM13 domain-containing protein n=1 Tax=Colwellia sp. 1_MG-2023 TaxID=3062649 RepID=UPI0026E1D14E|nr:DM13 domain-containing protein [Colwellia sp. 1_MG-2023]MDO6445416.1 DM13 domain-containing protein [Colwellia sp. 1_MG-2023]
MKCVINILLVVFISACGGGGSTSSPEQNTVVVQPPTTFTGVFIDSSVEGLRYQTTTQEGMTDPDGQFIYQSEEEVTFSIGGIVFPKVISQSIITPLEIFETTDINNLSVINALRLLQTIDFDGDADNGIQVTQSAHDLFETVSVDFSSLAFATQVDNLLADYDGFYQQLISEEMAVYHFQQTLAELNNQESVNCDATHSSVGQYGYFESLAHGVSGRAEIIDNCTIKVTEFYYDGRGPKVNFYVGQDHDYTSDNAFAISREINGPSYENAEFTLRLPNDKSLDDFNTLSVWCVEFSASFGQLQFTP